ncbi:MAG: Prolyl tripeptidyl peptidase precursor [Planctomycetota bacterium]
MRKFVGILFLFLLLGLRAWAQGTSADFERAASLDKRFRPLIQLDAIEPHWLSAPGKFWFVSKNAQGNSSFQLVDATSKQKTPLFDHEKLQALLIAQKVPETLALRLPLEQPKFDDREGVLTFFLDGRSWEFRLDRIILFEVKKEPFTLAPLRNLPRQSANGGNEIHLTFENKLSEAMEIFWLSTDGNQQTYGKIAPNSKREQHTFQNHVWLVKDLNGKIHSAYSAPAVNATIAITGPAIPPEKPTNNNRNRPQNTHVSTDGNHQVLVANHNLVLKNLNTKRETPLTQDGLAKDGYRGQIIWAPDSSRFVAMRTRAGDGRVIHLIESTPRDQLQPRLISIPYDKPGDNLDTHIPHLFDVQAEKEIPISNKMFPNPWSITNLRWKSDSSRFTFLYNQRGHQVVRLLAVNGKNGEVVSLAEESSKTFVDYNHKIYLHWIKDDSRFLWMSERDSFNHLYLMDGDGAGVRKQLTQGSWMVRSVDHVDDSQENVILRIMGMKQGQDPYFMHFARVNWNRGEFTPLTEAPGSHRMQLSPDGKYLIATWSRVNHAPVSELRDAITGQKILGLHQVDDSRLRTSEWKAPEPFQAKGRDGKTDIYGIILRPTNFVAGKKYPVIEQIYAGPHDFHVPKDFRISSRAQAMAELGFIVVQIDGMGTNWRGKAFHDVCWKNLADAGFPDRIAWMKAAAQKVPEMDLARVGIYGGSAGGQNAMRALIDHGDFYKAAAADCGCHDNRMDKVWWNELWMGWPVDASYEKSSNTVHAHKTRGRLLLTVGELDRNVDPATTMQVADALIKAGRDFELIVVPGAGHGAGESAYAHRRRQEFFLRHLWGNPN